jgi:hypothetical protein
MRGDKKGAKMSLRKVRPHLAELAEYERREFKEMEERVK